MITEQLREYLQNSKPIFEDILGQDECKKSLASALLAGRHIIFVGPPGVGKTTLAKDVSKLLPDIKIVEGCSYNCTPDNPSCISCRQSKKLTAKKIPGEQRFVRIQGSPDLTVEDLLGDIDPVKAFKYGALSIESFTPGKIFKANNGVLFFDEMNRCPEKIQNALLQVLEEKKATINSYEVNFDIDFIFIGTMNPEDSSTEKLSDVLVDRFDFIYMGYPETIDIEKKIILQKGIKLADVGDNMLGIIAFFVRLLREDSNLEKKPSVRASIGLYERAQSNALLNKRNYVVFDDIKQSLISVLAHRISLKPSVKYLKSAEDYLKEKFEKNMKQASSGIEDTEEQNSGDYR